MSSRYFSHGKLMISGEYLVLSGATAFALPVRFGQSLQVLESGSQGKLNWKTLVKENHWFSAGFSIPDFEVINHNDSKAADFVRNLLHAARALNPAFLHGNKGFEVVCSVDFDLQWGLGSSSSLISNVAYWAEVDPLELHARVSKGSGYDVACARSEKPILFKSNNSKVQISTVDFQPPFSENIFFIYLGRKKDSQAEVNKFMSGKDHYSSEVDRISAISLEMAACTSSEKFGSLMREHEQIMAGVLGKPTLKESLFSGFPGEIKSLGAWGGDFAMALWPHSKASLANNLAGRNLNILFGLNEMIYESSN